MVGGKGERSASAAIGGGAAEPGEDAGGVFSSRVRVVGQAGTEADGGNRQRGGVRGPAGVVEDGQVGGQG